MDMPPVHPHVTAAGRLAEGRVARRPHKKSRNGCENCKRRRIKCGEERPECGNCLRHSMRCTFAGNSPANPSSPTPQHDSNIAMPISAAIASPNGAVGAITNHSSPTPSSQPPPPLTVYPSIQPINMIDLELLHNFHTSTSYTMANIPDLQNFLRVNVPRIAMDNPFVMNGILALSALHLSRFKKGNSQDFYIGVAHHHYEAGLRQAAALLPNINDENCPPLYLFASFNSYFTYGSGPKPGDFLLFGNNGLSEWMLLFRGLKSIIQTNWELLRHGPLAPIFDVSVRAAQQPPAKLEPLDALKAHILTSTATDPRHQHYLEAVDALASCFSASPQPGVRSLHTSPQAVFVWPWNVSDELLESLEQRKPPALLLMAHYCVLLHDMQSFWWMAGWVEHLMSEIYTSLPPGDRMWMRWPMEEIGWIPG